MTKIKLVNGEILKVNTIELINGILNISIEENTVEELAELFSNKQNISKIIFMTENEEETGYKEGFTSFAGINYIDGIKTIQLFQPKDVTETRLLNVETTTNNISNNITDVELAIAELYEMIIGG
jgi:hypothetical protein